MGRINSLIYAAGVASLLLINTGCGLTSQQKTAVLGFGSATADFASLAQTELIHSRQDVIEMNRMRVVLGDEDVNELDGHFTLERTQARLRALSVLNEYGQLLQQLLVTSSPAELQASAQNFTATLQQFEGVRLSPTEAQALGRAVSFGGSFLVERKRAKAMKAVITLASPHVRHMIELVERDFNPDADFWSAGYRLTVLNLEGAAGDARDGAAESLADAQVIRGSQLLAKENKLRFQQVAHQISETAGRLKSAEKNLHDAMMSGQISLEDIQAFEMQVNELRTIIALLRPAK